MQRECSRRQAKTKMNPKLEDRDQSRSHQRRAKTNRDEKPGGTTDTPPPDTPSPPWRGSGGTAGVSGGVVDAAA